jgi:hypothetical protein
VRDQVRAGPGRVRRAGRQPFPDLVQLGLGRALPVPALPVLGEYRPPRIPGRLRRVHRDPELKLKHHTSRTANRFPGVPPRQAGRPALARSGPGPGAGCVGLVLISGLGSAASAMRISLFLLLMQVRGLITRVGTVVRDRIELSTFRFSGGRSYRLSYLTVTTAHCRGHVSGPDGI